MTIPFEQILKCVRASQQAEVAFNQLREVGNSVHPSPLWHSVPQPNVQVDIEEARAWLKRNVNKSLPRGVYLGLDTLNEKNGRGKNVEIGMTANTDPSRLDMAWAWSCERYGSDHLIRGLHLIHKSYEAKGAFSYELQLLADYVFFFGYSGVVLVSALEQLPVTWDSLFVWGFHDGDLAFLARGSSSGSIERLATLGGA